MIETLDYNFYIEKSSLGPNEKYARKEMWKVVYELKNYFSIPNKVAINIVLDEYILIKNEESATTTAIAIMRIASYSKALKYQKQELDHDLNK